MKITRSDRMAQETLREIRKITKGLTYLRAHVSPYENGREVGYVLRVEGQWETPYYGFEKSYTFSENRNSDDVVVYFGNFEQALRCEGMSKKHEKASEKMYEDRVYAANPAKAASLIVQDAKNMAELARKSLAAKIK